MPPMVTDLFRLMLEASWQSSLIILLILIVRAVLGAHVPARFRYLLWALVLIRLLVPVSLFPPNPVSLQNIAVVDRPMEQIERVPLQAEGAEFFSAARQGPERTGTPSTPMTTPTPAPFPVPWEAMAAGIWLGGVMIALGFIACAQIRLWRRLANISAPVDSRIQAIWEKCCQRLRIRNGPVLCNNREVTSPALVGLLHPILLVPQTSAATFSAEDWENVFVHELAHYRRADHWTNALHLVALAVHWFNPLVWIGFRQLRADRELAADEWALQNLGPERSAAYGQTLLKVLAQPSGAPLSMAAVGILEDRVQLKQRLQRIVSFGPRTLISTLFGLGIVVVAAILVLGRQTEKVDLSNYAGLKPEEILVTAGQRGDMPVIRKMLRDGVDVNVVAKVDMRQTALTAAASADRQEAMRFLISKGADINLKVDQTPSTVEAALMNGRTECTDYLLNHGAICDPTIVAAFHGDRAAIQSALAKEPVDLKQLKLLAQVAADSGQADTFRLLVTKIRTQPGQAQWQLGDGEVVRAISHGYRDVVQAVLDESPYQDKLNQFGVMRIGGAAAQSPGMQEWLISKGFKVPEYTDGERLIDAAEKEDIPEMDRLFKKGVDINYRGESSWTPITKAATWGKVGSVKFLLAHGADPNSVHLPGWDYTGICLTGKPEIADMLLAAGGKINATLYKRNVHIMDYCVTFGPTEMVKWFIDHGVDPSKVQADGPDKTFLFNAANPEIAELLIQHGVDPKQVDKEDGTTALHWICMFGKQAAETARVLLKHGADPNARSKSGITPLMWAKDGATVDVLVEYGADINAKTRDGQTMIATSGNVADASRIEALIRHGAPFDPKTNGATMMMRAAWSNQVDIIAFLLNHGVDPNLKGCWNKEGNDYMTPLTAAITDGQYDAAKLLLDHGARIEEPDENGKSGLNNMLNALHNRRTQMVKLFWENGDRSISELCYAVSQGKPVGEIQKLLDGGIPADPPQDKKFTPLAEAALLGEMDVVQLLVQHGADVNAGGALNPKHPVYVMTPIMMAASEGQDETVDFLLRHGAKFEYETLWETVWNCHPYPDQRSKDHFEKTTKLLIDAGGLKSLSEKNQAKLLCAAIFSRYPGGNQNVIKMLLDAGLSLHTRGEDGKTVMELAQEACKESTCSTPSKEMMAFLEQANGGKITP
jgi:ankyrin repeat protein/beta-lactamase regulating signal transducer with metallopeptidase domain